MAGRIGKQYWNIRSAAKNLQLHRAVFNHIRLYGFYWYWALFGYGSYLKDSACQLCAALCDMVSYGLSDM